MSDHADIVREFIERASAGSALAEQDALAALDALVAERDEARKTADGMARAPYGEFEAMRVRAEAAGAEVERLEAENDAIIEAVWRALPEHGGTCPRDDPPTTKTPCIRCCVLAELNSVRAALAPKEDA